MFTRYKEYLYPPVFEDEQTTRVAQLLHKILWIGIGIAGTLLIGFSLFTQANRFQLSILGISLLIAFITLFRLRRGKVKQAGGILVFSLFVTLIIASFYDDAFRSGSYTTLLILIFFAGLLLGQRGLITYTILLILSTILLFLADQFSWLPPPFIPQIAVIRFLAQLANIFVAAGFSYFVFQQLQRALAHSQTNKETLERNNQRLHREIEERKQAEQALVRSNAILQAVFEAVPDGILAVDQEGQFVAVNGRFRQMWGVPSHIQRSKPARAYVHKKLKDPETFNRIIEESYLFPDMERKHLIELVDDSIFESYSHPQIVDGESIGRVWTYRNITALKQTEEALRTSEQQFRQLFELAPIGMAITNINGRFIQVNPAFCDTVGYTQSELQDMDFVQLTHPDDVSGNLQLTQQLIKNNIPSYQLEKRYVRKNGTAVDVFLQVSALRDPNGQSDRLIAQVVDLSNLHQAEEALRQAQKLESLGMMSSGIAHDFNNLLTVMLAQASLTEAKLPKDSPIKRHIQRVLEAAKQASTLTQQLLTYSGQRKGDNQPVSLNIVIQESLPLLQVAISKVVQLETTLSPRLPLIIGDEGQLQQVVMNLVLNAAEAMDGKAGQIHVVTRSEIIEPQTDIRLYTGKRLPPGQYVLLEVSDNGVGMDEATLNKVFDPFFTTKRSGHGLGLATVLGIVRGHQGGLHVTSKMGIGTIFQLYFPLAEAEITEAVDDNSAVSDPRLSALEGVVLVVDDEEHVREAAVDVLTLAGLEVLTAVNGQEGLQCYQQHRHEIKAILLDVVMPQLNGTDMLAKLRKTDPDIPVILSSGYSQPDAVMAALKHPNTYFLRKPYRWDQLVEVIRPFLQK